MTITELIEKLQDMREKYGGGVDVTVWQYGGGMDDLCDVSPVFDPLIGMVVLDTSVHDSGLRR